MKCHSIKLRNNLTFHGGLFENNKLCSSEFIIKN